MVFETPPKSLHNGTPMLLATASITAISTPALTFNCKKSLMEIKIINKFIKLKLHKILVKSINVYKPLEGIYIHEVCNCKCASSCVYRQQLIFN